MKKTWFRKDSYIKYFASHPWTWNKKNDLINELLEKELGGIVELEDDDEQELEVNVAPQDNPKNDPFIEEGNRIGDAFIKKMKSEYGYANVLDLSKVMNAEIAAKMTYEAIKEGKHKLIMEACFIYNGAVARLDAYDVQDNAMIECKATTSTKFKYILDTYYQYLVMKGCGYNLDDIRLALIAYKSGKKYDVHFAITNKCHLGKGAKTVSSKSHKEHMNVDSLKAAYKLGKHEVATIMDVFRKSPNTELSYELDKDTLELTQEVKERKAPESINIFNSIILTTSLDKVIKEVKDTDLSGVPDFELRPANVLVDCTYKKEFEAVMATRYPSFNISGKVMSLKHKIEFKGVPEIDQLPVSREWQKPFFMNHDTINDVLCNAHYDELYDTRVYYDFETVSSGIICFDNAKPFMQIPFQCSIIKTHRLEKTLEPYNNLIIDPKNMDVEWFKKIVDDLYEPAASYIVYNAAFEKGVLRMMAGLIDHVDYYYKIGEIVENTWDLALFFQPQAKGTPMVIHNLRGKYSIKKVQGHIDNQPEHAELKWQAVPYPTLAVYNGMVATEKAKQRFFSQTSDQEWLVDEADLRDYCENDVVSMLMVEEYTLKRFNRG